MSDDLIFREVDEDVRRERMEAVWKRYGGIALAVAVLIVAGVAGSVWYRDYEKTSREEAGDRFEAARNQLVAEDFAGAANNFEAMAAENGSDGYGLLAALQAAEARAAAGETGAALSAYDRLVSAGAGTEAQRDLIRLKAALLALESEGGAAAVKWLQPVIDGSGPFRMSAREIRASALLKDGDREGAIAELRAIAEDADTSAGQRDRVQRFLLSLGG